MVAELFPKTQHQQRVNNKVAGVLLEVTGIHEAVRQLVAEVQAARIGIQRLHVEGKVLAKRIGDLRLKKNIAHVDCHAGSFDVGMGLGHRQSDFACNLTQAALNLRHEEMHRLDVIALEPGMKTMNKQAHVIE